MMRWLILLLVAAAVPVRAQEQDIQRQLIQRQQQSDAFLLQLRQFQERTQVPPGDLKRQRELDARQTSERQRLDDISARQLLEVKPDTPQELRSYERQKAEEERRPLTLPAGEFSPKAGEKPQPLNPSPRGIVQVIEAPR